MQPHIAAQYRYLRDNYGPEVAENYRRVMNRDPHGLHRERWVSNTRFQERVFNPLQAAVIRVEKSAGYTCREIATKYGVSQGTISQICRGTGAYR